MVGVATSFLVALLWLLAKSIQSSRKRSVVNSVFNYVEEVSTARKDEKEMLM